MGTFTFYRALPAVLVLCAVAAVVSVRPAAARPSDPELRLGFDRVPSGQAPGGDWTGGCFDAALGGSACIHVRGGGSLHRIDRDGEPAIAFPAAGEGEAVVSLRHTEGLNPGTADFSVAATVRLSAGEGGSGANVVQKGLFGSPGGQWKLQVDAGVPSCRVSGERDGARVDVMVAGEPVGGRGWVRLVCMRADGRLGISVDGGEPRFADADAAMDIANTAKVTVGGRVDAVGANDQLHGDLDDVVVDVF